MVHNYTVIKVVRSEDLYQQIGRDVYFDLVDLNQVPSFRVPDSLPFNNFKSVVSEQLGVSEKFQRYWSWGKRKNETYRPHRPLTHEEETQHVNNLKKLLTKDGKWVLILLLEVLKNERSIHQSCKEGEDILLFFKLYNPEKEDIRYVGKLFVKCGSMPGDILKKLNEMANYDPDEDITLFEEIKFVPTVMCEPVNKERTFLGNQLENGDIICFQKASSVHMNFRNPDVPSFLEYIHGCQRLEEAKLKVITTKDKLKKAEENVAPLQLKVISLKGKLKEAKDHMAPLHLKVKETRDMLKAIEKALKEAEENVTASELKATLIENELKEAEKLMKPLQLEAVAIDDELKEAEKNVAALEAMLNP